MTALRNDHRMLNSMRKRCSAYTATNSKESYLVDEWIHTRLFDLMVPFTSVFTIFESAFVSQTILQCFNLWSIMTLPEAS